MARKTGLTGRGDDPVPPSSECTFIVLDAAKWQAQPGSAEESCMVGDVNLFLTDLGDPTLGEIEVMIAGSFPPFWALDLLKVKAAEAA